MAAAFRTSAAGGSTSGTTDRTVAITAALDDLIVVCGVFATNTNTAPTCTDDKGGLYTLVHAGLHNSSADMQCMFVRNGPTGYASSHTITVATGSNSAGEVVAVAVSGMSRFGTAAIRQSASQDNQAAGTPAPAFSASALTGNVTIGMVANATSPATMTAPTGWTGRQDVGQITNNAGVEVATRDSGFTGTTVTWGSASGSAFGSIILELDGSAVPTFPGVAVAVQRIFNTAPTTGTQTTGTVTTPASGSTVLLGAARGTWANGTPTNPFDNKSNTFTALASSPHSYTGFVTSSTEIMACANAAGGSGHTASLGWGASSAGSGDEVTISLVEVDTYNIVQDSSWVDQPNLQNTSTSGNVTTTGAAVLIAYFWGYSNTGQLHVFRPQTDGWYRLASASTDGDPDPTGYVQCSVLWKQVAGAGTYNCVASGTAQEGAQIYVVALQQGAVPTNYSRSLADSAAIPTDALARFATFVRGAAGSAAASTDSAARVAAQIRGLSDSAGAPTDAAAGSKVIIRALADSDTAPTGTAARVAAQIRGPADSDTAPTGAAARIVAQARAVADSDPAPTDAATRAFVTARAPTDTATAPTAAVSRSLGATRVPADNDNAPTDAVARTTAQARALADSDGAPTDATSGLKLILRAGSDSAPAPADSVARQVAQARAIADSDIAPVGGLTRAVAAARGIADSDATPTATGSGIRLTIRATADASPAPTDGVARSAQQSRAVAESLAIPADAITRLAAAIRGASSSAAAPTSGLVRVTAATRAVSDALVLPPDAVARLASAIRAAAAATAIPADAADGRVPHGAFAQAVNVSIAAPADQLGQLRVNGRAASADVPAPTDVLRYKHGSSAGSRTSTPAAAQSHTKPFAAESYTKPTRAKIEEQ